MSANQKLAFASARESFQSGRLAAYFAKRYIARVVVYPVKRGDMIAKVARAYGEVPLWLLEEFNQADFRALQPGDTILIPVVEQMKGGRSKPPHLQVVDQDGRPVTDVARDGLSDRMRPDLLGRARLAIDDSNVFERAERREAASDQLLPARIGHQPVAIAVPAAAPLAQSPVAAQVAEVAPRPMAPAVAPTPPRVVDLRVALRELIVKPGETVSHFAAWSSLTVQQIRAANPGLDPKHLGVGQRVMLPLSDLAYADFVLSRAGAGRRPQVVAEASPSPGSPAQPVQAPSADRPSLPVAALGVKLPPKPAPVKGKKPHKVAPGETASGIAARYGISLTAIARLNPGRNLDRLYVGDKLQVPATATLSGGTQ